MRAMLTILTMICAGCAGGAPFEPLPICEGIRGDVYELLLTIDPDVAEYQLLIEDAVRHDCDLSDLIWDWA